MKEHRSKYLIAIFLANYELSPRRNFFCIYSIKPNDWNKTKDYKYINNKTIIIIIPDNS
jgi:hypothetical protein